MTSVDLNRGSEPSDRRSANPGTPPVMELRTYTCLRLGAIGVIGILAISLAREYHAAGECLRESISAYYYSSVQSVLVGALVTLGFVMIVLWGKTAFENGALNLAGLVAPVVAFVPTADANLCGLPGASRAPVSPAARTTEAIYASRAAIANNVEAYLVITGAVLLAMLAIGIVAHAKTKWQIVVDRPSSYWCPLTIASALWVLAGYGFWQQRNWFYEHAHAWSARTLFFFIVLVVANIGAQKWRSDATLDRASHARHWAITYWSLAAVMTVGAVTAFLIAGQVGEGFAARRTYLVEAWMIFWLAVFWALQTWDRWRDGAPPRAKTG
jgi:hypothetical protein